MNEVKGTSGFGVRLLAQIGWQLQKLSGFFLAEAAARAQAGETAVESAKSALPLDKSAEPPAETPTDQPASPPAHWLERVQAASPPTHWLAHTGGGEQQLVDKSKQAVQSAPEIAAGHEDIEQQQTAVSPPPLLPHKSPRSQKASYLRPKPLQPARKAVQTPVSPLPTPKLEQQKEQWATFAERQKPNPPLQHQSSIDVQQGGEALAKTVPTEVSTPDEAKADKTAAFDPYAKQSMQVDMVDHRNETTTASSKPRLVQPKHARKRLRPLPLQKPTVQKKRQFAPATVERPEKLARAKSARQPTVNQQPTTNTQQATAQPIFNSVDRGNKRATDETLDLMQKSNFLHQSKPILSEQAQPPTNRQSVQHQPQFAEATGRQQATVWQKEGQRKNGRFFPPTTQFSTSQPAPKQTATPFETTNSQPSWPALPEKQSSAPINWEKERRERQRRQRLDQEQQGGAWSA